MGMGGLSMFHAPYLLVLSFFVVTGAQPLVPAMFIFGDSAVDVGNNNHLFTIIKSNFPPYGRDFLNHRATGRFSNGKLSIDFIAEYIGFDSHPPPYLSQKNEGKNLLNGANFASGSCGYFELTAKLYNAIPLSRQIQYYKQCQNTLVETVGKANASSIIGGAIYLVAAGSSDFLQNYYTNPLLHLHYSVDQFSDILAQNYAKFVKNLYALGARRIGVTTLPPLGCLPAAITIFGMGSNKCVEELNTAAASFNDKLNETSISLQKTLPGLKLVVLDIYQPLHRIATDPGQNGFLEARRGCCGTGLLETSILCSSESVGTCSNATAYVFWDSFHPSEAANKALAEELLVAGSALIS